MVTAQLIIIGDELVDGRVQDVNSKSLATYLKRLGVHVVAITLARDDEETLYSTMQRAWQEHHLIITTGGLGPTKDDITKKVIAKLAATPLESNGKAQTLVSKHYARINRDWNPATNDYHLIPKGVEPLPNPVGLAPGLCLERPNKMLLAAPGVPRELTAMLEDSFQAKIVKNFSRELGEHKIFHVRTFGIPEEKIFFELEPQLWQELEAYGKVSSLPQAHGVDIAISMPHRHYQKKCGPLTELFKLSKLAPYIWQFGDRDLPHYLLEQARRYQLTIACAESCTGGLASSLLTDVAGCSDVFLGSAVTYSNQAKHHLLGVDDKTLEEHGAVSEPVATQMADGARQHFASDLAISYSGIAGPGGGSDDKPVGTVAIAISSIKQTRSYTYHYHGNRLLLKKRFALRGLFHALEEIKLIARDRA